MALFGKPAQEEQPQPDTGMPLPPQQQPYPEQQPPQQAYEQPMPVPPQQSIDETRIEELAEAIIDEKWNELLKDINKMIEWKEKTDSRLARIEQEIQNLKSSFESLHKGILGKVSEYDQNLVEVGTEIKAMEKVFQKILPTFTDNVNKLSRITDKATSKK